MKFEKTNEPRWYVAHTYSGHENKVKINLKKRVKSFGLEDYFEEILIPTQEKIEVKEGKRKEVTERIFPGYVLVKTVMNDETFTAVKGTPAVTAFVGTADTAVPLSEKEIEAIKKFSEQEAPRVEAGYKVGDGVKITDGPFADFVGTVDEVDEEKGTVKVLVNIFGRETPVELDFLQVSEL